MNDGPSDIQNIIFEKEKTKIRRELCRVISITPRYEYKKGQKEQEENAVGLARHVVAMADGISVGMVVNQDIVYQLSQELTEHGMGWHQAKVFVCQVADELLSDIAKAAEKERQWFAVRGAR